MIRQLIVSDANAFGNWRITRWPAMPPEAPSSSYVVRWKNATEHGRSVHPTRSAAEAAVPFTNQGVPTCPMAATTRPPTATCAMRP
jgi:hypothetical protein